MSGGGDNTDLDRRQLLRLAAFGAIATAVGRVHAASSLKATAINHVSYSSADYRRTRDFYRDLFGFQVSEEDERQLYLWAGDVMISAKNAPAAKAPFIDHFGATVDPWNADAVGAALEERRLPARFNRNDPHDPNGRSAFTKDPNGYNLQLGPKDLAIRPAPIASTAPLTAIGINHLSYQCADYGRTRDFYAALLGVPVSNDDGRQAYLWFGDAFMVVRNGSGDNVGPVVDHVAWTLADWDAPRVLAELRRHGLDAQPDTSGKSVMTRDINGYPLQLCSAELAKRS